MSLRVHHRLLVIEALFCLLLAKLALLCLPYRLLVKYMSIRIRPPEVQGQERKLLVKAVRRSILRASQQLPVRIVCFPRAIAAQAMLRRRRIATVLYYGAVTQPGKGLVSHAWVQDGPDGVIGLPAARGYKVIATYPE